MTRAEIKDELYRMLSDVVNGGYPIRNNTQRGRYREAVKEAMEVLDHETCEDCISRADIQDYIAKYLSQYLYDDVREAVEVIDEYIGELPSVTSKPKTGHWIEEKSEVYKCSSCGGYALEWGGQLKMSNYCPNCGARMEVEE